MKIEGTHELRVPRERVFAEQRTASDAPNITPSAEAILKLATPIFAAGLAKPASEAAPIYVRNRVALTSLEREQGMRL